MSAKITLNSNPHRPIKPSYGQIGPQSLGTQSMPMMSYDSIDVLPVDQSEPTPEESRLVDTLFKKQQSTFELVLSGIKDILLLGVLFMVFSTPQVDQQIAKFFPSTANSPYILLMVKTLIFMVVYFFIKNMYLVKKQ